MRAWLMVGCLLAAAFGMGSEPRKRGEVWLFLVPGCPIAQRYAPEVQRLAGVYGPKGFEFKVIFADASIRPAEAQAHLKEFGYKLPYQIDQNKRLRTRVGATRTPTVAVVLPDGRVAYRGRIDDRYRDLGRNRPNPTRRDLAIALDEILAGRRVSVPRTEVVGCVLPP